MKRFALRLILLLFLCCVLISLPRTNIVKARRTIYIRAGGSVEPPTTSIQRDGDIYTLTNNVYDEIVVERSNIIIDGDGYTLQGSGSGNGFSLCTIGNVTIKNTNINGFECGVYLNSTSYSVLSGNNITANNNDGIALWYGSSSNSIYGNNITNNRDGIAIVFSGNNYNTVFANNITNNGGMGIYIGGSSYNTISGNNITNNDSGIYLIESSDNTVCGNNITNNDNAVSLYESLNNPVFGNNIINNNCGVTLAFPGNNKFYHNNFVDNTQQVRMAVQVNGVGFTNFWDDGVEGNYWSNYTGVDLDHDGIGNSPHIIDANNTDNYPLMGMFHGFNTSVGYYVNVISNSTIKDFEYFESNSTIKMHVYNMTTGQTFGFCRVCIPKNLISPPYTVIIDDGLTEVLYFNETIRDNDTHRWIYFAHPHSIHKINIIPEFPSIIIMPLLIATVLAFTACKRKHWV